MPVDIDAIEKAARILQETSSDLIKEIGPDEPLWSTSGNVRLVLNPDIDPNVITALEQLLTRARGRKIETGYIASLSSKPVVSGRQFAVYRYKAEAAVPADEPKEAVIVDLSEALMEDARRKITPIVR